MRSVLLLLPLFACATTAVVGEKSPLDDDTGATDTADTSDTGTAAATSLADLLDLSVNQASATVDDDGLHLLTESGTNAAGGFNGAGTGNKAIAGVPGLDGHPLAELTKLAWEATSVAGTSTPYLNVVIDPECLGERSVIVVADTTTGTAGSGEGGSTRYAFAAGDSVWKAVGGLDDLLPSHVSMEGGTLTSVIAAYPDVCLRDTQTGDGGMPAATPTTAVLILMGDSTSTLDAEQQVSALEVGEVRLLP